MKKFSIIISLIFSFYISNSQSSFSVRISTISAHPFAKHNLVLHQNPIDNKGYLTFEPGIIFSYDKYLANKLAFRISTAVHKDRFNTLSGYSQILIKYKAIKYYKHSLYLGFGPAIHYETNKLGTLNYVNEDKLKISNNTMYKIAWLSGMLEYNYYYSKKMDFALTLNHIHTRSIALSLGIRFALPDPNGKGCDCPSFR